MASVNIDYSFSNGTTANALEVNANFQSLKAFVDSQLVQADGSVKAGTAALQDSAVTAAKIASGSVTEVKIADNSVTNAKMADNAVGTAELVNGSVNFDKLINSVPRGVVAKNIQTGDSATGGFVEGFSTVQFTTVPNRLYKVSASFITQSTLSDLFSDSWQVYFRDTVLGYYWFIEPPVTLDYVTAKRSYADSFLITTETAVTFNLNIVIQNVYGSATHKFIGGAGYNRYLLVEDLGMA